MNNKKHQVDTNLINSVDALAEILLEHRITGEPSFENRPKSTNDPVPNDPFWTPKNCYLYASNRFYKRWPAAEAIIANDPKSAVNYAINVLDDAWPDDENGRYAESLIKKDPSLALWYAKMVKGRWEGIEPSMATKPEWAYDYAKNVLEHQWDGPHAKDAEAIISNDPYTATLYCMDLKHPKRYDNPQTERRILDSIYGALYARTVAPELTIKELNDEVNNRLEALHADENIDFTNVFEESYSASIYEHKLELMTEELVERDYSSMTPSVVYTYAITDFKTKKVHGEEYKPDPKAEAVMMQDPGAAYYYARDVLNDGKCLGIRWEEAEPTIMSEPYWAYAYAKDVLGKRWKTAEKIIKSDTYVAYLYARDVVKPSDPADYDHENGRWDLETESRILEDHDPVIPDNDTEKESEICELYAKNVAEMTIDELKSDIENKLNDLNSSDDTDLTNIDEAIEELLPLITESRREDEKRAMALFHIALDKKSAKEESLTHKQKNEILKSPEYAYKYAKYVLDGEWVEAEPIILTDQYWAFNYAKNVIKGTWEAAEPLILGGKDLRFALSYAIDVSKVRLAPMAELRIIEHFEDDDVDDYGYYLDDYCTKVAKMSVEDLKADAELKISELTSGDDLDLSNTVEEAVDRLMPLISENEKKPKPDPSKMTLKEIFDYLNKRKNRGKRWPEAEPYIMKDTEYAFDYAYNIINKEKGLGIRWPEAEPYIMKEPWYALDYVTHIINNHKNLGIRWRAAEPYIMTSPQCAYYYAVAVINKRKTLGIRWPEAEPYIIRDKSWAERYASNIAQIPYDQFLAEVEAAVRDLHPQEDKDFTGIDESIDRLMPLITEGLLPDPYQMTAQECYNYAYNFLNKDYSEEAQKWKKEAEQIIKTCPDYATSYATNVLNYERIRGMADRKKRFFSAEEYIMKSPKWAYIYARDIYSKSGQKDQLRWEEAEPFILQDPKYAYFYAQYVAHMPLEAIQMDVYKRMGQMFPDDNKDFTGTTDEAIDRLLPLITEDKNRPDPSTMTPEEAYKYAFNEINNGKYLGIRWPEAEPIIIKSPKWSFIYARNILNEGLYREGQSVRWPGAEPIIKQDAEWAFNYALDIINRGAKPGQTRERWLEAEPIIKQDPEWAYKYTYSIINKGEKPEERWIEAEPVIMRNPYWADIYARYIIQGRWYQAESNILKDPEVAYFYAETVADMPVEAFKAEVNAMQKDLHPNDDRDLSKTTDEAIVRLRPLIENKIDPEDYDINRRDALECYTTAKYVIKKRWPKAEPKILTHPYASYLYANYVLDRPWKEAEPIISTDAKSALYYAQYVLKRRWPEGEPAIKQNPEYAYFYAQDVIKPFDKKNPSYNNGRWEDPVTELLILNAPWELPYAERIAEMPREDLLAEIELLKKDMAPHDDINLTGTTDEAIDRLMPLITEDDDKELPDPSTMSPTEAFEYVYEILNHGQYLGIRWEEAEPIIAKNPELAYYYATSVINNEKRHNDLHPGIRNKTLEDGIKDHPKWAYYYAWEIINRGKNNGIRWYEAEPAIILNRFTATMYSKNIANMPVDDFITEVEKRQAGLLYSDDRDLTGTTEEAIDRLMPLMNEASRKDYWGRRKEFKEFHPISNWLDKAINKIRAKFFGSYPPQFQQSVMALKAKADEYRKKGADNFKIGSDMFSYKEPYPPKEVIDDRTIPSSIKSLLVGAFHDEENKLNKEYENLLKDTLEHEWPAPTHKKQKNIQYDLRRRLRGEAIAAREHIKNFKETTSDDDLNLSEIDEE